MYGYIYKTTNLITNKIYVGKKKGVFDLTYFGSGIYLAQAIKFYGIENFKVELIQRCKTLITTNKAEKFWISKINSLYPAGYNLTKGGDAGDIFTNNPRRIEIIAKQKNTKKKKFASCELIAWNKNKTKANDKRLLKAGINESKTKKKKFQLGQLVIWNKGQRSGIYKKCADSNCHNTIYVVKCRNNKKYCSMFCKYKNQKHNQFTKKVA